MNNDISTQLQLAARDNRRAAMAIEYLERAQEDANRANEALKSAQDQAKVVQHAAEQSLAKLKAMSHAEQATAFAISGAALRITHGLSSAELPFVIVVDRDMNRLGAELDRLITKGRMEAE